MRPTLYLASRSPRRQQLLAQIGVAFRTLPVDVDETPRPRESAADYVCRVAREKAEAGRRERSEAGAVVLGADTAVVLEGRILGKPADRGEAQAMLSRLSGREHEVMSAVCVAGERGADVALSVSRVAFAALTPGMIAGYIDTGEPDDKAGAYAIQGRAAVFVKRLEGSYSGVVGLPLYETARLLRRRGIPAGVAHE